MELLIAGMKRDLVETEAELAEWKRVLYRSTGKELSNLGFGQHALSWAMNPKRETLMKRRYEDMLEDAKGTLEGTIKRPRSMGGGAGQRRSRRRKVKSKRRSRSRPGSRKGRSRR